VSNIIDGEPYFKFWRLLVLESWGETTVSIDSGEIFGRDGGPNLLDYATDGFASDGFPSFNGWNANLSPDGTAYVGAEWQYPIAPRAFDIVAEMTDCPKRFVIQCSIEGREWYQFGLEYELPQGGVTPEETCPLFTLGQVLAHGQTQSFIVSECEYSTYGTPEQFAGCELYVFYGVGSGNDAVGFRLEFEAPARINAKCYSGTWPDLVLEEEHFDVLASSDEPFTFFIYNDNSMIERQITVAITAYDDTQTATFVPRFQAVCS
jgi:hypothetical protein